MRPKISELLDRLEINAPDSELLDQAFRHGSMRRSYSYRSLELLGDKVIEAWLIQCVLERRGTDLLPADIVQEVQPFIGNEFFCWVATHYGLVELIRSRAGGMRGPQIAKSKIRADVVEAFVGALQLIGGTELSGQAIEKLIYPHYRAAYPMVERNPVALLRHFLRLEGKQFSCKLKSKRKVVPVVALVSGGGPHTFGQGDTYPEAKLDAVNTYLSTYYGITWRA